MRAPSEYFVGLLYLLNGLLARNKARRMTESLQAAIYNIGGYSSFIEHDIA